MLAKCVTHNAIGPFMLAELFPDLSTLVGKCTGLWDTPNGYRILQQESTDNITYLAPYLPMYPIQDSASVFQAFSYMEPHIYTSFILTPLPCAVLHSASESMCLLWQSQASYQPLWQKVSKTSVSNHSTELELVVFGVYGAGLDWLAC